MDTQNADIRDICGSHKRHSRRVEHIGRNKEYLEGVILRPGNVPNISTVRPFFACIHIVSPPGIARPRAGLRRWIYSQGIIGIQAPCLEKVDWFSDARLPKNRWFDLAPSL